MSGDNAGLCVESITVKFGGLVAVSDVSLSAPPSRMTGLIGPNGAGKTTTFNACTGLVRPTAGKVHLWGEDVTRSRPMARGRLGMGRTFQRMELYDSLTAAENVALGREAVQAGRGLVHHVVTTRSDRRETHEATTEALADCGLEAVAHEKTGRLPTGVRRLVELARALAGGYRLLLLDEPSSGLDGHETRRFGEILAAHVAKWGTGVLLVEHDMALVRELCDYVYVLDFGKLIFEGTMHQVMASPVVKEAYLGSESMVAAP